MLKILVGIFLVLHGGVHLLYAGQSKGMFELQPGLTWPEGSWAFSRTLGNASTRTVNTVSLVLIAILFIVAGIGMFAGQPWGRQAAVFASAISILLYLLMWNGKMQGLDNQGFVGILIDVVILVVVLVFHWPSLG